jgi:hypothetical protein
VKARRRFAQLHPDGVCRHDGTRHREDGTVDCPLLRSPAPAHAVCGNCGGDDFRTVEFCADCGEPPQKVDPNARGPFICYHCMHSHHHECIGAACKCSCEGPHPLAPASDNYALHFASYGNEARSIAMGMCCSCGSREHAQRAIMALVERVYRDGK